MAESSFGFNSAGASPGDRAYSAVDYMTWMDTNFGGTDGVVAGLLNELAVTSLGGYQTSTNTGGCVWNGYTYNNSTAITKTHSNVATTNKRYDRLVVRFDTSVARSAVLTIIEGTPSTGSPSIPSLGASDVAIATLYIDNTSGSPSFTVTDNRVYRTAPVAYNQLTSDQMATNYKHRGYHGGAVSGTVTLPTIQVGETMVAWYTGFSVAYNLPSTGTFNSFFVVGLGAMDSAFPMRVNLGTAGGNRAGDSPSGPYASTMCIYTRTA